MFKSLKIEENTKERIDKEKIHHRQTYDEILNSLLDELKELRAKKS